MVVIAPSIVKIKLWSNMRTKWLTDPRRCFMDFCKRIDYKIENLTNWRYFSLGSWEKKIASFGSSFLLSFLLRKERKKCNQSMLTRSSNRKDWKIMAASGTKNLKKINESSLICRIFSGKQWFLFLIVVSFFLI